MKNNAYFALAFVFIALLGVSCAKPSPTAAPPSQTTSSPPPVSESQPSAKPAPQPAPQPASSPAPATSSSAPAPIGDTPQFSTFGWKTDFSKHNVPYSEIISGGVGKDGIPPIYAPKFESVPQAGAWLTDADPVAFLQIDERARAYPLSILIWHEIVNDEVAGVPVTVTFCPLCNTVVVFERRLSGGVHTFGVSGLLRNSDLIMWDHETESLWQQATGEAIAGELTGQRLTSLPSSIISWRDFKASFPDGEVLSRNTGYSRPYGRNPYTGYDTSSFPFLFTGKLDPRLPALERVIGVSINGTAVAYPFSVLRTAGVVNDSIGGKQITIFYFPGTVSPLDETDIEKSREIGSAAVFYPDVQGKALTFKRSDGKIMDQETASTWNIFGKAIAGPLKGQALTPAIHGTHFWFAWAAFNPDTRIYQP